MDSKLLALSILYVLLGTYVFLFGFLKKFNGWYFVSAKLVEKKKHSLPPGDLGWPFVGNTLLFIRAFRSQDPDSFIHDLIQRCGKTGIYKTHLFGNPSIIVCTSETCRKVLLDDQKFGPCYRKGTVELIGDKFSFHDLPTAEYKHLRKLITAPISGHEALSMCTGNIEDCEVNCLDELASMNHQPIEFFKEVQMVFFKILTKIFLGSSADSLPESTVKYYNDLHKGLLSLAINIPGFSFHKALKARKILVKILEGVFEERKAMKKKIDNDDRNGKKCVMDLFMEVEDEKGQKLADEVIVNLLLIFLVAGQGSSASASSWAAIHLHDYPETLQRAKEEQEEIVKRRPSGHKGLNLEEIKQMKYLSKVIDETMRINSLLANFRVAKDDANIHGYFIPKGWKVLVWSREVHMDPGNYENPKLFLPSRWNNHKPKSGVFMPFGAGIRMCRGSELAKLQISIFLHYFLNYKLEQINPGRPVVYMLSGPTPSDKCLARVTKLP